MAQARLDLPAEPGACREVRRHLVGMRERLPVTPFTDVLIVADELVTQAVLAGPSPSATIVVEVEADESELSVAVEDSADSERPAAPAAIAQDRLGLVLVNELADRWGIERRGGTTRSWAAFALPIAS
jgi:hypothetical protein